ncbi:MAG: ATP-binding cassette domain-containing protein [Pseudomonadota bacterium]|nr:ATP-binding cassette domain-containing protein [Pseudomonadota bacterium]
MILELENVSGGYGDTLVHRDLSLRLAPGKVLGVIGCNGTGKTTLARMIGGEIPFASGRMMLEGREVTKTPSWTRAKAGVVRMPQTDPVFDALTVAENLALLGDVQLGALGIRFPRIAERMDQVAGSMSGGERKILGFVRAMLTPAKVIVLDEPSEGVQPENIAHMQTSISDACGAGSACILLEQNISMVEALADEVIALDSGRIVYHASGADISRDAMLKAISL